MTNKKKIQVAILMGSGSDWPVVREAVSVLEEFAVAHEVHVLSAHRTPEKTAAFARAAAARGIRVIIAAAGRAAHLAGVVASYTTLPVIGVPLGEGPSDGMDALLATVQMPRGIPVATTAVGRAGTVNAAVLAVEILALNDAALRRKLTLYRRRLREKVQRADAEIRSQLLQDRKGRKS